MRRCEESMEMTLALFAMSWRPSPTMGQLVIIMSPFSISLQLQMAGGRNQMLLLTFRCSLRTSTARSTQPTLGILEQPVGTAKLLLEEAKSKEFNFNM